MPRRDLMKRELFIKKEVRQCFRVYVAIIKPFLRGIRDREADVFAELLYFNYVKRSIPDKEDRFKVIFNSDIKNEILKYIGISDDIYRNCLSSLRKRELITDKGVIHDVYLVYPEEGKFGISFNFEVVNEGGSN